MTKWEIFCKLFTTNKSVRWKLIKMWMFFTTFLPLGWKTTPGEERNASHVVSCLLSFALWALASYSYSKSPLEPKTCSPHKGYIFTVVVSPTVKMSGNYTIVLIWTELKIHHQVLKVWTNMNLEKEIGFSLPGQSSRYLHYGFPFKISKEESISDFRQNSRKTKISKIKRCFQKQIINFLSDQVFSG